MKPKNITGSIVRKITLYNMLNGADKEYCVYITIDELSRFNVFRAWGKIGAVTHLKCEGFQDHSSHADRTAFKLVKTKRQRSYCVVHDDLYYLPGHPEAQEYVRIASMSPFTGTHQVVHGKIEEVNLAKKNKHLRKSFKDWLQTKPAMKRPEIIAAI